MNWRIIWGPALYLVAYGLVVAVFVWWGIRTRKRRPPFKRETKVLRQPGESLQRKIVEMDENYFFQVFAASAVPPAVGLGLLWAAAQLSGWWALGGFVFAAITFALAITFTAKRVARKLFVIGNHRLGCYGERIVGDALMPLERKGWRVFHDFPRQVKAARFNIDHIAIGPGGVFAIETKTPRKGDARPGKEGHVVEYNGSVLSWPWEENQHGIQQALDNAEWLEAWIRSRTGLNIRVKAVLVFPDWMVRDCRTGPLRVVSSSLIAPILEEQPLHLSEDEIDRVARIVDPVCRDVEY
jgi:hypothetical protein